MTTKEEEKELTTIFKSLDLNNDGLLTFDELVNGYHKVFPI